MQFMPIDRGACNLQGAAAEAIKLTHFGMLTPASCASIADSFELGFCWDADPDPHARSCQLEGLHQHRTLSHMVQIRGTVTIRCVMWWCRRLKAVPGSG